MADAQETADKLQQAWLETEAERERLLRLQVKTMKRLRRANLMLLVALADLIWALLIIFRVL